MAVSFFDDHMKTREDLRVFLLQFREDDATLNEEFNEFVRYSGLRPEQFTQVNAWYEYDFCPDIVDGYDCVFLGGSSSPSVTKPDKFPFVRPSMALVKHCYDAGVPTFGSCFGFQLAVQALGGEVQQDDTRQEIDIVPIGKHANATDDPLFSDMPESFFAVSIHRDSAVRLPDGAVPLAATDVCPFHAIRMEGKPFYATQFHPEINKTDLIARWERYWQDFPDKVEHEGRFDHAPEISDAHTLLSKFVDRVVLVGV